jgi:2-polyprenyl-6-methoxyphenol hydroxylase-like FAD-dependent oxidoreductase
MGMSDAFASAELLAEAINAGLVGQRPIDAALFDYQNKRDALTANGYALALSTARLAPLTPELEAFYGAAADQPEVIRRIFGVIGGSLPIGMLLEHGA